MVPIAGLHLVEDSFRIWEKYAPIVTAREVQAIREFFQWFQRKRKPLEVCASIWVGAEDEKGEDGDPDPRALDELSEYLSWLLAEKHPLLGHLGPIDVIESLVSTEHAKAWAFLVQAVREGCSVASARIYLGAIQPPNHLLGGWILDAPEYKRRCNAMLRDGLVRALTEGRLTIPDVERPRDAQPSDSLGKQLMERLIENPVRVDVALTMNLT
jgi:hypothetical protein